MGSVSTRVNRFGWVVDGVTIDDLTGAANFSGWIQNQLPVGQMVQEGPNLHGGTRDPGLPAARSLEPHFIILSLPSARD